MRRVKDRDDAEAQKVKDAQDKAFKKLASDRWNREHPKR